MGDISEHFNRSEFACKCGCGFDTVDIELIEILETVRHRFMRPITITSGCRCADHNYKIGGSKDSQHIKARAADFKVQGVEPKEVYEFLCSTFKDKFGFGLYSAWVHGDSRQAKARW